MADEIFPNKLPSWVKRSTLEEALQDFLSCKTIKITDLVTTNAVPAGKNYMSDLFRTLVKYTTNNSKDIEFLSIVVKCAGDSGQKEQFDKQLNLFSKECAMYSRIIPKLHKILGEECLSPECLLTELEPYGHIILRDLAPLGYKLESRRKGLNMDHCTLVLANLAKMHASFAVFCEKNPFYFDQEYFLQFSTGYLTNTLKTPTMEQFVESLFVNILYATTKLPGLETLGEKIYANRRKIWNKSNMDCARIPDEFNVVNHGDLHTNNILFKYDRDGKPIDTIFVDFQFSIFTTPSLDLQHFLTISPDIEIRNNQIDKLVEYYYEHLVKNLLKLNYSKHRIPTYRQIYDNFRSKTYLEFALLISSVARNYVPDKRDDATMENLLNGKNDFTTLCYSHPEYLQILRAKLIEFDKQGYFD